jgi:hypothetical protein
MRSGRGPRGPRRRIAARLAAVGALTALSLLGAPGAASAAGTVTPLLDCVVTNSNGTLTEIFGYANTTGQAQSFAYGYNNVITPARFDRVQPTTYYSGTYHGVFKVTVSLFDFLFLPSWRLNGDTIDFTDLTGSSCPPATAMPSEGNGTGPALGLLAAGVFGAVVVRRAVRRAGKAVTDA